MKQILLTLLLLACLAPSKAQRQRLNFEGQKREFIVYTPKNYSNSKQKFPLVFNFHGGGMSHLEQMFYTNMNKSADKNQFIVVYPLGINKDWNVGFEMSYQKGSNDIGFVKEILSFLKEKYQIDEQAIFATGLSRGGFLCHRIAAEMPTVFAAVAAVGAPLPDSVKYYHQAKAKIAVLQVHGTADEVVKYEGKEKAYASALVSFNYWKAKNEIHTEPTQRILKYGANDTEVTITTAQNKTHSVKLISIKNGGHTWPGTDPFNIGFPLGYTHQQFDVNQAIWQFFSENRK